MIEQKREKDMIWQFGWAHRLLNPRNIKAVFHNKGIVFNGKSDEVTSIPWSSLPSHLELKKTYLVYKVSITDKVIFRFLTLDLAQSFREAYSKFWLEGNYEAYKRSADQIEYLLSERYVRSNRLGVILDEVKKRTQNLIRAPKGVHITEKQVTPYRFLYRLRESFERVIQEKRRLYIEREKGKFSQFFDQVESNPLTSRQRDACVVDDSNNLVLAGAGTGKTSVMVAKAGYLLQSKKVDENEILLLAFGNKAATELDERIAEKLGHSNIQSNTFHKLGKSIIQEVEERPVIVSDLATDDARLKKFVDNAFNRLLENDKYYDIAFRYFEHYFYPARNIFDFQNYADYVQFLKKHQIRTLDNILVKSYEELLIGNFLFTNGINYCYENPYKEPIKAADFRKYCPDFYLPDHDIYIEHFGIDREGNTASWIDKEGYNAEIRWKQEVHKDNNTTLVETYHY